MNTVIIVEGSDNVGKTTLIRRIENSYPDFIVQHFGPNKTKAEGEIVAKAMIDTLKKLKNTDVLMDRSPFGEFVYGKMYRKYEPFTYWDWMVTKLNKLDTRFLFIVLYGDEQTFMKFGLNPKTDEKLLHQRGSEAEKVSVAFINVANMLHEVKSMTRLIINSNNYDTLDDRNAYIMRHIDYFIEHKTYKLKSVSDYTETVFGANQRAIDIKRGTFGRNDFNCSVYRSCKLGREHEEFSKYGCRWRKPTSYCGNITNPRVIFVGEAPGYLGCGTYGIPFYGDRSGFLFYNALYELNVLTTEIYVTNVIKCCPKANDLGKYYNTDKRLQLNCARSLDTELLVVNCKKVIALGNVASFTLNKLGIKHEKIYHPAYYLYRNQPGEFIKTMRNIF